MWMRKPTETDKVSSFISLRLSAEDDIKDILEIYGKIMELEKLGQENSDLSAALSKVFQHTTKTNLWALLQELLEGEKKKLFSLDGGCSRIAQDLVDRVEDEIWRRRIVGGNK